MPKTLPKLDTESKEQEPSRRTSTDPRHGSLFRRGSMVLDPELVKRYQQVYGGFAEKTAPSSVEKKARVERMFDIIGFHDEATIEALSSTLHPTIESIAASIIRLQPTTSVRPDDASDDSMLSADEGEFDRIKAKLHTFFTFVVENNLIGKDGIANKVEYLAKILHDDNAFSLRKITRTRLDFSDTSSSSSDSSSDRPRTERLRPTPLTTETPSLASKIVRSDRENQLKDAMKKAEASSLSILHKRMVENHTYHILAHTIEMILDNAQAVAVIKLENLDLLVRMQRFAAAYHDIEQSKGPGKNEHASDLEAEAALILELEKIKTPLKDALYKVIMTTTMHFGASVSPLSLLVCDVKRRMAAATDETYVKSESDILMLVMTYFDVNRASYKPIQKAGRTRKELDSRVLDYNQLMRTMKIFDGESVDGDAIEAALIGIGQSLRMMPELLKFMKGIDEDHAFLKRMIQKARTNESFEPTQAEFLKFFKILEENLGGEIWFTGASNPTLKTFHAEFKDVDIADDVGELKDEDVVSLTSPKFSRLIDKDHFERLQSGFGKLKAALANKEELPLTVKSSGCCGGFFSSKKPNPTLMNFMKVMLVAAGNSYGVQYIKDMATQPKAAREEAGITDKIIKDYTGKAPEPEVVKSARVVPK